MAYPDFSELSFGYCFLRELETRYTHGGRFPKAPDFITQYAEGTRGYDVEVAMDGAIPLFIQLKRSEVMTTAKAREFGTPWFNHAPVYRMNLHYARHYAQHKALQDMDTDGDAVIYATSQIDDPMNLSIHATNGTVISSASAIFAPNEIQLPDFTGRHHVSFYAGAPWAAVFSDEGKQLERRFPSAQSWLSQLLKNPHSQETNRQKMRKVVKLIRSRFGDEADQDIARFADGNPAIEAAILAYFVLDAQLTFVKPPA